MHPHYQSAIIPPMIAFTEPTEKQTLFDEQAPLRVSSREFRFLSAVACECWECTRVDILVSDGAHRTWEIVLVLRDGHRDNPCWMKRMVRRIVADWLLENQYQPRNTSLDNPVEIEWPPRGGYQGVV